MSAPVMRLYADTSVFGGILDDEFAEHSRRLLDQVVGGRFLLVTSVVVQDEALNAPRPVRRVLRTLLEQAEVVDLSDEAAALRDAYLAAGIVGERRETDALHVALATVAGCDALVSWNFRHIVHINKARRYNEVNAQRGYPSITICSPPEVVRYEDQEEEV
ncbi:MAG: type II toxin-antitoxin system VapC family toxin [Armatimonadetes bacterium]|nr:type II toxin-antitoxin system VapC family toxin [Armatimonadota bacterium]